MSKVVMVLNCLRSGGAEKQLLWIAGEIVRSGWQCCIFELTAGESTERIETMARRTAGLGVRIRRAPLRSISLETLEELREVIAAEHPALVWSWGLRADAFAFLLRVQRVTFRWLTSIRSANTRASRFAAQRLFMWACDGVVSNTWAGLRTSGVARMSGLRSWVLPNAVDGGRADPIILPRPVPQTLIIVMLGNIKIRTKGYDIAAAVAKGLRDRGMSFELRIAGRPDEIEALEESFEHCGVRSNMRFNGEVSRPEEFLRQGHLYLLLSRFEGMPNTLLEALQVGLPAIATNVGDLGMLHQQGAPFALVPIENAPAVVSAIERAWNDWEETRRRGEAGPAWIAANFSEDRCRTVLREILEEVGKR